MFKKGLVTLVCLIVMSAAWSWATATYTVMTEISSLGTKLNTATGVYEPVKGGSIKTRATDAAPGVFIIALQELTIPKGSTVTEDKNVEVQIAAYAGYKIASVVKTSRELVGGVETEVNQTLVSASENLKTKSIIVSKPAIANRTQSVKVTFTADTTSDVIKRTWQLQANNNNGGGSFTLTRAGVETPYLTVGKPLVKNYVDTTPVTVTATPKSGYTIDYVVINGVKDQTDRPSFSMTVSGNPLRLNTFNFGYKKDSIQVTTTTIQKRNAAGELMFVVDAKGVSQPVLDDLGILPINPVADPYGTVRLIVSPVGTKNTVTAVSATGGTLTYTDRFGDPATLPHVGALKVTIKNITGPITVTASYATSVVETPRVQNCTQTCHLDTVNVAASVRTAATEWQTSPHATTDIAYYTEAGGIDCVRCHYDETAKSAMPGKVVDAANTCLTCHTGTHAVTLNAGHAAASSCLNCHNSHSTEASVATCATCHTATVPARHTATHNACASCHNLHDAAVAGSHAKNMAIGSCATCHAEVTTNFATSQHGTRQGKDTWYSDNIGNAAAPELQKGFGNYVNVTYAALPCGKCHNAAAWTPAGGTDQWATLTGGKSVCQDCHGNRAANADTTAPDAAVTAATCKGCHSRQGNEGLAGLTDVHTDNVDDDGNGTVEVLGCMGCHSTSDMHGTGTQTASQLVSGTISAQCGNCHGEGKAKGAIDMTIPEHSQHIGNIDCSTCHTESMITCHNCHFDNEAGAGGAAKAKFFSGRFGGKGEASWRYLVNRKMGDGSYKVYPGSMQSLAADYTVDNVDGAQIHTHAGIAPYYSHSITKVNALRCAGCHGTENAVKLAAGVPVRVTTWNAAAGVAVAAGAVNTTFTGPKGVIPVPENPRGKLLMDFVDLTNPELGTTSNRVLLQKDGPDTIHMPEAFVKPMSAEQMADLAAPYRAGLTNAADAHTDAVIGSNDLTEHTSCAGCHVGVNTLFSTSQHGTRQGKDTWYSDNIGNTAATELQKGFGNYVNVSYASLPCGKCHAAAAWTVAGVDQWAASTGGKSVCTDCHGNKAAGADTTTVYAPVAKSTCFGCHSRQANEASAGLSDVHFVGGMLCKDCHSTTDFHGTGTQTASQLVPGTISAQCENCHGEGKSRGPISNIAAHMQHADDIACSTCHAESMITCHNCHFDNEGGLNGAAKAKFFSGKFGGTHASGNSWRFLVNRVMADGSTKIYPGSMQSLATDFGADGLEDGQGHTHAGIAPYYSHTITRVNALSCDKCHGTETAVKLAAGQSVRVTTWTAEAGVAVAPGAVATTYVGPKGVIPVPENPRGKLLMDFVDLTNPELGANSNRVLFQKDGPDSIHMPEAFVKPLTAAQMQKLASVQFDHTSAVATSATPVTGYSENTCGGCHTSTNASYATSQHFSKTGKATWFNDHLGNTDPGLEMQTGFGNYVTVGYDELPCKNCHNGGDNGPWDSDPAAGVNVQAWPGANCTECHTNRSTYGVQTTSFDAPVAKATCYGCHSRQKKEAAAVASGGAGLVDVHTNGVDDDNDGQTEDLTCMGCHSVTDVHGNGTQSTSQLQWGTISAQCDNCHGAGKQQGVVNAAIPEHDAFHLAKLDCSTCHVESVVTCNNCHFDNEMGGTGIRKLKFASGFFGGLYNADPAQDKSWRYLINRVMKDGTTKVYPGSMQSLYTDVYAKNAPGSGTVPGTGDDTGWSHAGIAPYYSHSITKVNALKCDRCHGVQAAIDLNNNVPIRVVTWIGADDATVAPSSLGTLLKGPKGIVPVPENPKGKLLMDFVDLVDPNAALNGTSDNIVSLRKLAQRNGPDSIHIPEAFAKPLTAGQINSLSRGVDRSTGAFLP